ncbi:MAG: hypothetical protein Q4D26_12225 [Clostridia bacterium]|nr:hypothetical protein [Clostridia bacterium]
MRKNILSHINECVEQIYNIFFRILHVGYMGYLVYYFFTDAKLNIARLVILALMLLFMNSALLVKLIDK